MISRIILETQLELDKMATVIEQRSTDHVYGHDYGSVRTRISWGAILAGSAVALAIYALLMSLGVAVGLSVDNDLSPRNMGTGSAFGLGNSAGVWGFISLLVSLFAGGWVTTQVTVGESRAEAILYGVVLWATTSVLLFWLTTAGIRAAVTTDIAMNNMSVRTQDATTANDAQNSSQVSDNRQFTTERVRDSSAEGAWWAFAGILLSMVAAIGGAMLGPVELTLRRDNRYVRDSHTPVTRHEV